MASQRMLEFLVSLPLSVWNFNQKVHDRKLLYSGPGPYNDIGDNASYNVIVCSAGLTYLVSFCCPGGRTRGPEIFTAQIRQDYWGQLPPVDWLSLVVDGAQKWPSFSYP